MPDPLTVAEGLDTVAGLVSVVGKIISAAKKVVRFKRECRQLASESTLLSALLEKNKSVLNQVEVVQQLNACLSNCLDFVIQCQEWSKVTVALEVTCRHRYPELKHELQRWTFSFNTQVNVSTSGVGHMTHT
jgi:hypothetical protein